MFIYLLHPLYESCSIRSRTVLHVLDLNLGIKLIPVSSLHHYFHLLWIVLEIFIYKYTLHVCLSVCLFWCLFVWWWTPEKIYECSELQRGVSKTFGFLKNFENPRTSVVYVLYFKRREDAHRKVTIKNLNRRWAQPSFLIF